MRGLIQLLLFFLALTALVNAEQERTNAVLVVIENDSVRETHSRFIDSLVSIGKKIEVILASTEKLNLLQDGEYAYDAVVLLCPTADKMESRLPVTSLIRFVDSGGNLFLAAAQDYSWYTEKVAESIGVDLQPRNFKTTDHQQIFEALDDGSHTYIRAGGHVESKFLFGSAEATSGNDIVFSGPAASLFGDNELIDNVIWGSGSCYGSNGKPLVKIPRVAGNGCVLGAALSTRTGSRAAYFGSFDALSNAVFDKAGKKHEEAMTSFLAWTLGHAGVLRAVNLKHSSIDDSGEVANEYRVKDTINFSVDIQQWDGAKKIWKAYAADDIQIEFVMLNPWVRQRLQYSGHVNGTYTTEIPVPDQIGVYKFSIQYFRPGVSPIVMSHVVPVRPYLHNEYERFIGMATPYYVASFSMLIGVFVLGIVVLYGGQGESVDHEKRD